MYQLTRFFPDSSLFPILFPLLYLIYPNELIANRVKIRIKTNCEICTNTQPYLRY